MTMPYKHIAFKQALLKNIDPSNKQAQIETPDGNVEMLDFDALILATGGNYSAANPTADKTTPNLFKPAEGTFATYADRKATFQEANERISAANNILVVGGGPTGIETACQIKHHHALGKTGSNKQVAICTRSKNLINAYSIAEAATKLLMPIVTDPHKGYGVEFKPETPYTEDSDVGDKFDYIINCAGIKFEGPKKFMTGPMADCLEPRTGQIMTNKFFQVTSKHPFLKTDASSHPVVYDSIFAMGDVALLPTKEVKCIASIVQYASIVYNNVNNQLCGKALKPLPDRLHELLMMATGKQDGIFLFNASVSVKKGASQEKYDSALKRHKGWSKNDEAEIIGMTKAPDDTPGFLSMIAGPGGCCCCCGCHICWNSSTQDKKHMQAWDPKSQPAATPGNAGGSMN